MSTEENRDELVSTSFKWKLWFGAWGAVVFIGALPYPSQLLLAPFFPIGLLALLPGGEDRAIEGWMQIVPSFVGWGFYFFLSVALFSLRKKNAFILFYIVFCVVLALNLVGCKKTLAAVAGIH